MKKCNKCEEVKPRTTDYYYKGVRMKDGLKSSCKECDKKRRRELHASHSEEYKTWLRIKNRCYNKKGSDYKTYGEIGIKVSDEWLESYDTFKKDMNKKPSDKHSIDRIDNNGNYEKDNCRWATSAQQMRNRGKFKNNTTGYTGVIWLKNNKRWAARITVNYKRIALGTHEDIEDAIAARKAGEAKYWGR